MQSEPNNGNICCENGEFGDSHNCMKQPCPAPMASPRPITLDIAVHAAVKFGEALGDNRRFSFYLQHTRTHDYRREKMKMEGAPIVYFTCHAQILVTNAEYKILYPDETALRFVYQHSECHENAAQAVILACRHIKEVIKRIGG